MKPTKIFIHHIGYNHSVYTVNYGHKRKGYPKSNLGWYVGYQWFFRNGKAYQTREETEIGMHNIGHNEDSIGLGVSGNRDLYKLNNRDKEELTNLLREIQKRWNIPNSKIFGHRDTDRTICPGKHLMEFLEEYKKEVPITMVSPPKSLTEPSRKQLQEQLDRISAMLLDLIKKFREMFRNKS